MSRTMFLVMIVHILHDERNFQMLENNKWLSVFLDYNFFYLQVNSYSKWVVTNDNKLFKTKSHN